MSLVLVLAAGLIVAVAAIALLVRGRATSEPAVDTAASTPADTECEAQSVLPAESEAEVESVVESDPEPEAEADSEPEAEVGAEADAEAVAEVGPEAEVGAEADAEAVAEVGPEAEAADAEPEAVGTDSALASLDTAWSPIRLTDSASPGIGMPAPRAAAEEGPLTDLPPEPDPQPPAPDAESDGPANPGSS